MVIRSELENVRSFDCSRVVDGYNLPSLNLELRHRFCFRIHSVAYARHCQQVLRGAKTNNSSRKHKKKFDANKCKAWQVRQMIPCLLPNQLLTKVTKEVVQELQSQLLLGNAKLAKMRHPSPMLAFKKVHFIR